jgi:hypothetical protein
MSPRIQLLSAAVAALVCFALARVPSSDAQPPSTAIRDEQPARRAAALATPGSPRPSLVALKGTLAAEMVPIQGSAAAVLPVEDPLPAAQTLAHARVHGDDRAPPIDTSNDTPDGFAATPWDLASPENYRAFELRGGQHVLGEYRKAAGSQVSALRAALDEASSRGVDEQSLTAAEEKIRRLEAVLAGMKQSAAPGR